MALSWLRRMGLPKAPGIAMAPPRLTEKEKDALLLLLLLLPTAAGLLLLVLLAMVRVPSAPMEKDPGAFAASRTNRDAVDSVLPAVGLDLVVVVGCLSSVRMPVAWRRDDDDEEENEDDEAYGEEEEDEKEGDDVNCSR
jgi:hypothetical protein